MEEEVKKCADILAKGGVILYPTDTVWGLGCDATNEQAVQKIWKIKQRAESKSMLVLVAEFSQVSLYADIPATAQALIAQAKRPLTVIYPDAKGLAKSLVPIDGTIGIRVVNDAFCKQLIGRLRKPIVSTSANISGQPAPANFYEISTDIKQRVDYVANWRQHETKQNAPSQIIKIERNGTVTVIRP